MRSFRSIVRDARLHDSQDARRYADGGRTNAPLHRPPPCSGGRPACRRRRHPAASPRPHFYRKPNKPSQSSGIVRSFPSTGRDARLYGRQDARRYADGGRTNAPLHRPPPCSGGRPACRRRRHPAASPRPHFSRKPNKPSQSSGVAHSFLSTGRDARLYGSQDARRYADGGRTDALLHCQSVRAWHNRAFTGLFST